MKALVIPESGPLQEVELDLDTGDGLLAQLQGLVGGDIEAVPVPDFIDGSNHATAYVNAEGKFNGSCLPNMRATDFLVPGIGLFLRDWVAGPFVLCGFDPETGDHAELPAPVIARARLIESEAGTPAAPETTNQ